MFGVVDGESAKKSGVVFDPFYHNIYAEFSLLMRQHE